MRPPVDRVDASLLAALAAVTGADKLARHAADLQGWGGVVAARFTDHPFITFSWDGLPVFLTAPDAAALATAAALLIRFAAWFLAPVAAWVAHLVRRARR